MLRLLSRFLPRRLPVSECRGDGRYAVVGTVEEKFQGALGRICAKTGGKGADYPVSALLIPTSTEDDPHAFRIKVAGRTVGYLCRPDARRLQAHLRKLGYDPCIVMVAARIRGGAVRKRGPSKPYFLALDLPGFIGGGKH